MRRWIAFGVVVLVILLGLSRWLGAGRGPDIEPGSTLVLSLTGRYVEAPEPSLLARALGQSISPFVGLLSRLALAERDDRIATVVLDIEKLDIGWAKAEELRRAIGRLRQAGRRTVAYLEIGPVPANREYYIASAADEIQVVPGGSFPLVGLAAEYLYLGGLWEKFGIEIEVARVGRYKSAVETLAGRGMSDDSREMSNALLDSTERQFIAGVAEGRGAPEQAVRDAFDHGPVTSAEQIALGLIDGEAHLDEILDRIGAPVVLARDYAAVDPASVGFDPVAQYALIYGSGTVIGGDGGSGPSGSPVFAAKVATRALEEAAKAEDIDAIILRIDSPGGSALASELIWRAVKHARETSGKPVIASFSDYAASGGYYVASAADYVVSAGTTLTGSIGVFTLRPVLGGLLEKLGIGVESLTRGRHADFMLSSQPLSPGSRARLEAQVADIYDDFISRVSEGRSLEREAVHAIAQGRVWTGEQALAEGLVDEIGGLREAVDHAKSVQGLEPDDDVVLVTYPPPKGLAQEIAELFDARIAMAIRAQLALPDPLDELRQWLAELPARTPLLVPPGIIEIH